MVIYIVRELYLYIFQYNMIYRHISLEDWGAINETEQLRCNQYTSSHKNKTRINIHHCE